MVFDRLSQCVEGNLVRARDAQTKSSQGDLTDNARREAFALSVQSAEELVQIVELVRQAKSAHSTFARTERTGLEAAVRNLQESILKIQDVLGNGPELLPSRPGLREAFHQMEKAVEPQVTHIETEAPDVDLLEKLRSLGQAPSMPEKVQPHELTAEFVTKKIGGSSGTFSRCAREKAAMQVMNWPEIFRFDRKVHKYAPCLGEHGAVLAVRGRDRTSSPNTGKIGAVYPALFRSQQSCSYIGHYKVHSRVTMPVDDWLQRPLRERRSIVKDIHGSIWGDEILLAMGVQLSDATSERLQQFHELFEKQEEPCLRLEWTILKLENFNMDDHNKLKTAHEKWLAEQKVPKAKRVTVRQSVELSGRSSIGMPLLPIARGLGTSEDQGRGGDSKPRASEKSRHYESFSSSTLPDIEFADRSPIHSGSDAARTTTSGHTVLASGTQPIEEVDEDIYSATQLKGGINIQSRSDAGMQVVDSCVVRGLKRSREE